MKKDGHPMCFLFPLANLLNRDYLKFKRNLEVSNHGPTQIRKTKEGQTQR